MNAFADTMAERGIRTRNGLDELLEGWKETTGLDVEMKSPDSDEDELEYNASELRRLRPY